MYYALIRTPITIRALLRNVLMLHRVVEQRNEAASGSRSELSRLDIARLPSASLIIEIFQFSIRNTKGCNFKDLLFFSFLFAYRG